MQAISITGEVKSAYAMTASHATYILEKGASITTDSPNALFQQDGVDNTHLVVKGHIIGGIQEFDSGVTFSGFDSDVKIAGTGIIEADVGVTLEKSGQQVLNHGTIDGSDCGVWLRTISQVVTNFGHISGGEEGIQSTFPGYVSVVNEAGGHITSQHTAVEFGGADNSTSTLTNDGFIAAGTAFSAALGNDKVINHGQMNGGIYLGAGDDTFDNRGGKVNSDIQGQLGNDTLITDDANVHLHEELGEGTDTVKSTVTYTLTANVEKLVLRGKADIDGTGTGDDNSITGNQGDNKLLGLTGADTLDGRLGNDLLKGGLGKDVFIFAAHGGQDTIADFKSGADHIDLSGQSVISDFDDMINNHMSASNGDLVIDVGTDTLTLRHIQAGSLDASDFSF